MHPEDEHFVRNVVSRSQFLPYPANSMQENPRKYINELMYLGYASEIGLFSIFYRCRISVKEVLSVFQDYSTIITRVKYAFFCLISGFFPRLLLLVLPILVLFIMSFCFEHPVFFVFGPVSMAGGP